MKKTMWMVILLVIVRCSMYHLQTPDTVPPGRTSFGIGLTGINIDNTPLAFPGFWARTGITNNVDIGVHSWGLGLLGDVKLKIVRFFGIGSGLGFTFVGASLIYLQGSLYGAIPLGIIEPYTVIRGHFGGVSFQGKSASGNSGSGVFGLRINMAKRMSLYGEIGKWQNNDTNTNSSIFGVGLSIGY